MKHRLYPTMVGVLTALALAASGPAQAQEKLAEPAQSIPGNPPRIGVAGKTGTWQIVFDNGAIITLEKVHLLFQVSPGKPPVPIFRTYFKGGQQGEASSAVKHERIIGIFLLKEDLNTQ